MPRVNVKDKRKQQLMEANIASIARRGLADTTITHVSKGADMSRGIVNFYFTSKEKMMLETLAFLAEEFTLSWQEALEEKRKVTSEPTRLIEAILRTLMGDKLCSARRLAVWSAFIGHAGTHAGYAKIIRTMDETLTKQLCELWKKLLPDVAEQRARQMQSLIRGHWLIHALGVDTKCLSSYTDAWIEWLQGEVIAKKTGAVKQATPPAKSRKLMPDVLPGQLDFGDLFTKSH